MQGNQVDGGSTWLNYQKETIKHRKVALTTEKEEIVLEITIIFGANYA